MHKQLPAITHTQKSHWPVSVFLEEGVELFEAGDGNLTQQRCELALPFLTVRQDGCLQGRAIQQNKLDVEDGLLRLHVVGYFSVPGNEKRATCKHCITCWILDDLNTLQPASPSLNKCSLIFFTHLKIKQSLLRPSENCSFVFQEQSQPWTEISVTYSNMNR